jgi:hypothetical protein
MKKFVLIFGILVAGLAAGANHNGIDERLIQLFRNKFPQAREVTWHETSNLCIANFKEEGIRVRATYRKNGVLLQFTRSYQEDRLPYYIQYRIKGKFDDKKVFGVIEVVSLPNDNDHSLIEYYIKLEDNKYWTTIKVDSDGEITVIEKFKKSA